MCSSFLRRKDRNLIFSFGLSNSLLGSISTQKQKNMINLFEMFFILALNIKADQNKMRIFLVRFLFFLSSLGISFSVSAQLSTTGKEFWLGFMENNQILPANPDQAVIVISANEDAIGAIEYLDKTISFNLKKGQQFTHVMRSIDLDLLHRTSGVIEKKGIYISSSGKIAVYAYNERLRSADGTVVLPIGALGKDYLVTSHFEAMTVPVTYNANVDNESTLLVVATEDNTKLEITPAVLTISGNGANAVFSVTLNRGESYQLKARGDLTGSRVRVVGDNADQCRKIAVFGGNKWTSVGNCGSANDHLFQQAYPINTWGTSFVHVALAGRSSGELVKVLASEDGTQVTVNGIARGILNKGKFLNLEFLQDQTAKITTSKPASVTVFSKSQACNQGPAPESLDGDPFMITYSPSEQLLKEIRFTALSLPSIIKHYVNIVVKTGTQNLTFLDGQNQGSKFIPVPGDPNFSYARINISQGVHLLSNSAGFTAYVYGFGFLESYGYAVGAALDNLNFQTKAKYPFNVDGENTACLNQEGSWLINSENPDFSYFVWDFGDGSPPVTGKDVVHTFKKPGKYEIAVVASLSPNSCDQQEEVTFEVEVLDLSASIIGEASVCPDVENIIYKLDPMAVIDSIAFKVEGGEIIQNYGDSILVNWGPANDQAKVKAIPFNKNGCFGDEITLNVTINQRIIALLPIGEKTICYDPSVTHFYTAPNFSKERGYEWQVMGGQIISGKNNPIVEVNWDQDDTIGSVSYRVYSLVDVLCEGRSDAFTVSVGPEFKASIADLKNVDCFGNASGMIELQILGGVPPYTFKWSQNASLQSNKAEGLPKGTYDVTIKDQTGCEINLQNIEIQEPQQLELVNINPISTSCFGKPDGTLSFEIKGGTPPYFLDFQGVKSFSSQLALSDLKQGKYAWTIKDSNGCLLPLQFEIPSPVALKVDVRLQKSACPGVPNGELIALPLGGLAPYVYAWQDNLSDLDQLIGVPKGIYEVSVTDQGGCVSLGSGEVIERPPVIRMPTGFNTREELAFQGVSNCEVAFEIWIYNRWGELVFTGTEGWDGLISGEYASADLYSYFVRYEFLIEGITQKVDLKGTFTLIR